MLRNVVVQKNQDMPHANRRLNVSAAEGLHEVILEDRGKAVSRMDVMHEIPQEPADKMIWNARFHGVKMQFFMVNHNGETFHISSLPALNVVPHSFQVRMPSHRNSSLSLRTSLPMTPPLKVRYSSGARRSPPA